MASLNWVECQNCLANYDVGAPQCPVCDAKSGSILLPVIVLDEDARDLINGYGGIWYGLLPVPNSDDFIVACETGLFRFSPTKGIIWDSGIIGLARTENSNGNLLVNRSLWHWESGKEW